MHSVKILGFSKYATDKGHDWHKTFLNIPINKSDINA
jgi:hypothetical protein